MRVFDSLRALLDPSEPPSTSMDLPPELGVHCMLPKGHGGLHEWHGGRKEHPDHLCAEKAQWHRAPFDLDLPHG
jgi:hypothetical protein